MQQASRIRHRLPPGARIGPRPPGVVRFRHKQVSGIDPLLAACLDRATEDVDRVVETIERRGGSSSGGGGGAPSVGSRVSKRSGMGSSRGKGPRRYTLSFALRTSLHSTKRHSLRAASSDTVYGTV